MPFDATNIRAARRHLRRNDAVLGKVIDEVGRFTLRPADNRFGMLVRSIISQQISTSAARSIRLRLEELVAPEKVTAASLLRMNQRMLKGVGLSSQKVSYVLDLARKVDDETVRLRTIGRKSDENVIRELTQIKGIGRWTAQMFLIFALARLDVFPHDDLGIKMALRNLYSLDDLPSKDQSHEIAEPWRPYATIASWYCWRSLELPKE